MWSTPDPLPIPSKEGIHSLSHVMSLSEWEAQNREEICSQSTPDPLSIPSQEGITPKSHVIPLSQSEAQNGSGADPMW